MNDEGINAEPDGISINVDHQNREIDDGHLVVEIRDLLEKGATWMGMVATWWAMMLMQGGIFFTTVETMDCIFIMFIFISISFRHKMINFTAEVPVPWGLDSRRSMCAHIKRLRLPFEGVYFIDHLSYVLKGLSAILSAVLSINRLVSQDFGPSTEGKNMATRNFALNAFYGLALIEALLSFLDPFLRNLIKPPPLQPPSPRPPLPPLSLLSSPPPILDQMNTYGQQNDQSNNFGVNKRKGLSVDPARNGKQTEEKKGEAKKSQ